MEKTILILQGVNFCFQNTRQSKDHIEWRVLGLWPKKLEFQKYFSKIDISLISFQQLDLNRHDLWSMRFDSRTRKIVKQRRTFIEFVESLTWNDINSSQNSLKCWPPGVIQWTLRRKTNNILISWGQRKNQMMSHQSSSKLCLASDNDKEKPSWV